MLEYRSSSNGALAHTSAGSRCSLLPLQSHTRGWCRYERSIDEPLVHRETSTLIFVHSVCGFHAASVETSRGLMQLAQPAAVAVCHFHDQRATLEQELQERASAARDARHVQQIADGYHRYLLGASTFRVLAPSPAPGLCARGCVQPNAALLQVCLSQRR